MTVHNHDYISSIGVLQTHLERITVALLELSPTPSEVKCHAC